MSRYEIHEIVGWPINARTGGLSTPKPGSSLSVLDTLTNGREVYADYAGDMPGRWTSDWRRLAEDYCRRLNRIAERLDAA